MELCIKPAALRHFDTTVNVRRTQPWLGGWFNRWTFGQRTWIQSRRYPTVTGGVTKSIPPELLPSTRKIPLYMRACPNLRNCTKLKGVKNMSVIVIIIIASTFVTRNLSSPQMRRRSSSSSSSSKPISYADGKQKQHEELITFTGKCQNLKVGSSKSATLPQRSGVNTLI